MSNVILGIESLSPVLLVLCYICNKCLLAGEENGVYFPRECVLVSERLEMDSWKGMARGGFPGAELCGYEGEGRWSCNTRSLQGFVLTRHS